MAARADSELYKDKIEVSLDGRQIFYLFFGGAVVACMVFVLGVMVGRRLEARAHVDKAAATRATRDPLAALDQLAAGRGDLSYPQTLAAKGGAAAEVDRALAAMSDKAKAADGKAGADSKDRADKAATDKAAADKAAADKAAADKAAADKAAADRSAKERADKERAAADKAAGDGDARPVDRPESGSTKGKFTLQLSSFQDKAEAEAFLGQVKGAGYSGYLVAADVEGVMWYRVRTGTYATYEDAVAAKGEFEKKVPKIAYVTRL
jgi:cell division septation protein DedD